MATLCEGLTHWKRHWRWERLKSGGEEDEWGWGGWMASSTQWTWIWVNSGNWWWTGRPGVLQSMGSQRVWHDWVTELNWTELIVWSKMRAGPVMFLFQDSRTDSEKQVGWWSMKFQTCDQWLTREMWLSAGEGCVNTCCPSPRLFWSGNSQFQLLWVLLVGSDSCPRHPQALPYPHNVSPATHTHTHTHTCAHTRAHTHTPFFS